MVYSAAKAAVINLTKSAAVQLAPDRIRVNAICPGGILTGLTNQGDPEAAAKTWDPFQPWPEHGTGEHIGNIHGTYWISGTRVPLDSAVYAF